MRDVLDKIEWRSMDGLHTGIETECETEYGTFHLSVRTNSVWKVGYVGYVSLEVPGEAARYNINTHHFTRLESVVNQMYSDIVNTCAMFDRQGSLTSPEMAADANKVVWSRNNV